MTGVLDRAQEALDTLIGPRLMLLMLVGQGTVEYWPSNLGYFYSISSMLCTFSILSHNLLHSAMTTF